MIDLLTLSDPARSTKLNLETTVTHSPSPLCSSGRLSTFTPSELAGRRPGVRWKLGVPGLDMGIDKREDAPGNIDPGLVSREGDRPGGSGEAERGGAPEPVNFRCVRVREKIA
jgi:hypothetical protein